MNIIIQWPKFLCIATFFIIPIAVIPVLILNL